MKDYASWARRKTGAKKTTAAVQQDFSGPPGPAPAGYAWAMHPQAGWVAIPLEGHQAVAAAPERPQTIASRPAYRPPAPIGSCTLVKPGTRDTYAELMATVPDLIPPSGYDAMNGNPDPQVVQALGGFGEYRDVGPGANYDTPTSAFPEGRQLVSKIGDLR